MTTDRVHRAFRIAYDGTPYHGFQRQPAVPTIENVILDAFTELGIDAIEAGYAAAGRTDAGVSAAAQTVAVRVPPWLDPAALNGGLPADVRAWAVADVDPSFHPRYDAIERVYTYHLHAEGIDVERTRAAAASLVGRHDFRDLSAAAEETTRELSRLEIEPEGDFVHITAAAPGFVHQQVRRIVSLLAAVGRRQRTLADVQDVLDPDTRVTGGEGIPPAPPGPLVLTDVQYDAVAFTVSAPDDSRGLFRDRAIDLRGRAASMATIAECLRLTADQHS